MLRWVPSQLSLAEEFWDDGWELGLVSLLVVGAGLLVLVSVRRHPCSWARPRIRVDWSGLGADGPTRRRGGGGGQAYTRVPHGTADTSGGVERARGGVWSSVRGATGLGGGNAPAVVRVGAGGGGVVLLVGAVTGYGPPGKPQIGIHPPPAAEVATAAAGAVVTGVVHVEDGHALCVATLAVPPSDQEERSGEVDGDYGRP